MKIANIIEEGRLGGPQIRIAEIAKLLLPKGYETTVIFPRKESQTFYDRLQANGISSIRLPLHRLSNDPKILAKYFFFFPYDITRLYNVIRQNNFDIVHVSGGAWQYKGAIAGKLAGCRVVWHLNDTNLPLLVRKCFYVFAKLFADCFVVAGRRVLTYYFDSTNKIKGKPIFEIQAPVDCKYFDPSKVKHFRQMAQLENTKIISIGNINPVKGFEYLLQAADMLKNSSSNVVFFIIGPHLTSQKKYYEKLEHLKYSLGLNNVHFLGAISDVRPIIKSADIYVCSSLSEASPLSIWEAMSMGKAIVSTDVGDVSRFIKDSENGFIVPPGDPGALAEKIAVLIENVELRQKFGEKSRLTAQKYLDIQVAVRNHIKTYKALMQTRK